jgi:DNA-directed RNA polymerase subunit RPC12/RpoP
MSRVARVRRKPFAHKHTPKGRTTIGTEELLLQPWFLPKPIARKIRSLLPPNFRKRLRDMFEDYGCLRCGRKHLPYQSNGMCRKCMMDVFHRIRTSANRRLKGRLAESYGKDFIAKEQGARRLLDEFSRVAGKRRKRVTKVIDLGSPVAAAFETLS